jgi:hypothetical protein
LLQGGAFLDLEDARTEIFDGAARAVHRNVL